MESSAKTAGRLAVPDAHNPPPGYEAPIVCDGVIDMRDVMVPMRDGKHLCVDIYRPNIAGKFPALLAVAPHNKEYQTPEFAKAVQWAQPAWSRMWFGGAEGGGHRLCLDITCLDLPSGLAGAHDVEYAPITSAAARPWCTRSIMTSNIRAILCCR